MHHQSVPNMLLKVRIADDITITLLASENADGHRLFIMAAKRAQVEQNAVFRAEDRSECRWRDAIDGHVTTEVPSWRVIVVSTYPASRSSSPVNKVPADVTDSIATSPTFSAETAAVFTVVPHWTQAGRGTAFGSRPVIDPTTARPVGRISVCAPAASVLKITVCWPDTQWRSLRFIDLASRCTANIGEMSRRIASSLSTKTSRCGRQRYGPSYRRRIRLITPMPEFVCADVTARPFSAHLKASSPVGLFHHAQLVATRRADASSFLPARWTPGPLRAAARRGRWARRSPSRCGAADRRRRQRRAFSKRDSAQSL